MSSPSLVIWILLFPLVLAVVDLVRTLTSLRGGSKGSPAFGPWSRALHIDRK